MVKCRFVSIRIIFLALSILLLSSQYAFPFLVEAIPSHVVSFAGSWEVFQSSMLDILGYQIYITGALSYSQDVSFFNDVSQSVLNVGEQVQCSTSISPQIVDALFTLMFHFGGSIYAYDYDFEDMTVPGTKSITAISIPATPLLLALGLPPLLISLDFDLSIHSQLATDIHAPGFSPTYGGFKWNTASKKSALFRLEGADSGVAKVFLSDMKVLHEVMGKISISVWPLPPFTLYQFPVATRVAHSGQNNNIAVYNELTVSSQYGSATGSGWYSAGTAASFALDGSIVEGAVGTRHVFQSWSGSGTGSYSGALNPATVTMSSPIGETALWETQHLLTIQTGLGGSTDPVPDEYWARAGSSKAVSASPSEGYAFKQWILDGSIVGDATTHSLTVDSPHTLSARFNRLPSASFSYFPFESSILDEIDFEDTSEDLDGTIASWLWNFGDENTSDQRNPSHQYADKGDYTVRLTVKDNDGAEDSITQMISVVNLPPTANFTCSSTSVSVDGTIEFTDSSIDPECTDLTSCLWDFGDAHTSTLRNPTHKYEEAGQYVVTLTITDDVGATDSITMTINVQEIAFYQQQWFYIAMGAIVVAMVAISIGITSFKKRRNTHAEKD